MNHMLDTQRYFATVARGEGAALPSPEPPELLGDDPVADFERARARTLKAFGQSEPEEQSELLAGIALSDVLLHGWDLAKATGQDATMPENCAQAAYTVVHGRLTDAQRNGMFKPEVLVGPGASPQQRLLAYTGRDPAG
jgi:uncharacterized protein (TIGR03086 family)